VSLFYVQMQDFWEGAWLPIGAPVAVEAPDAETLLTYQWRVGLLPGVLYRFHVTGPVDRVTIPTTAPAMPRSFDVT
jgi:hypothetical protein